MHFEICNKVPNFAKTCSFCSIVSFHWFGYKDAKDLLHGVSSHVDLVHGELVRVRHSSLMECVKGLGQEPFKCGFSGRRGLEACSSQPTFVSNLWNIGLGSPCHSTSLAGRSWYHLGPKSLHSVHL